MSQVPEKRVDGAATIYDPDRGLKSIAVSRAAEQHWRRAKDAKQLFKAVETKLKEQAAYVVWRDGVVVPSQKNPDLRGKRKVGVTEKKPPLPDSDPGKIIVHRWRKLLCVSNGKGTKIDQEKLKQALSEAALRCQRVCEMESKGTERGTAGTGEFERYTPAPFVEASRQVLGEIDLDPASNKIAQKIVKAKKYFTGGADDDGLKQEWRGRIFLNPPYHRTLQPAFIDKLIAEIAAGHVKQAIVLTNNSTDTEWFCKAAEKSQAICFTIGRVNFYTPTDGGATT